MLEIDVVGVETLCEGAGDVTMRPVVVQLQSCLRGRGKNVRPTTHHVPAAHSDIARAWLCDLAAVQVPLQGELVHL